MQYANCVYCMLYWSHCQVTMVVYVLQARHISWYQLQSVWDSEWFYNSAMDPSICPDGLVTRVGCPQLCSIIAEWWIANNNSGSLPSSICIHHGVGDRWTWPCITENCDAVTSILANGSTAFKWKLCCHWLKGLWQHHNALVSQGPCLPSSITGLDIEDGWQAGSNTETIAHKPPYVTWVIHRGLYTMGSYQLW